MDKTLKSNLERLTVIKTIQHYLDNPDDVPSIPPATSEYLQVRLNAAFMAKSGELDDLRAKGYSEAALFGFMEGLNAVVEIIEHMEDVQRQKFEDEQTK